MRKCRRQIVSFLFGAIIFLPILAIGILQLGQAYIRSTREERLETEKLVQVTVPVKDLVWEEEGRELWVGNQMFDVASYTIANGNYYLVGVYDDDETEVAGGSFFGTESAGPELERKQRAGAQAQSVTTRNLRCRE